MKRRRTGRAMRAGTYLLRNPGKSIPLVVVISLAVLLVVGVIALIDSIPYSIETIYASMKQSVGLSPRGDMSETPAMIAELKADSPVPIERIIVCRASGSVVHSIVGKWPFIDFGLSQADMRYFLRRQGSTGLEGRLPRPGMPEAVVTDPVARNLDLKLGSVVLGPDLPDDYSPKNVVVVGIAHTSSWLIIDPIEYQRMYHFPPVDLAMAFAPNLAQQKVLDAWATRHFLGKRVQVYTYARIQSDSHKMFETLFQVLNVVIGMLAIVITLMMGMLMNIFQTQRLVEFGLLQALGFTRRRLIARAVVENVIVVALGWVFGVVLAFGLLLLARKVLMAPHAYALDVFDPPAFRYTFPLPITILIVACGTVAIRFRSFDPVAIVERRLV